MSIDYSNYKKQLKEKTLPKFKAAVGGDMPPQIANLAKIYRHCRKKLFYLQKLSWRNQ